MLKEPLRRPLMSNTVYTKRKCVYLIKIYTSFEDQRKFCYCLLKISIRLIIIVTSDM